MVVLSYVAGRYVEWAQQQSERSVEEFAKEWHSAASLSGELRSHRLPHEPVENASAVPSEAHHYGFGTSYVETVPELMADAHNLYQLLEHLPHIQPSFPQFFVGKYSAAQPLLGVL